MRIFSTLFFLFGLVFLFTARSQETKDDQPRFIISDAIKKTKMKAFGPVFYQDRIVFAQVPRKKSGKRKKWMRRKKKRTAKYLDLFIASRDSNNQFIEIEPFSPVLNGELNEGPATFNAAGDYIIFTTNDYDSKGADDYKKLQLKESRRIKGKWKTPKLLPFNDQEYSVAHATLTPDGQTVYFVSDMPGGEGGADIYKAIRKPDGKWGKPVNLGNTINTEGDEMFPFIHPKGEYLYFSSDQHNSLGGLDIYISEIRDTLFSKPQNLGAPINSAKDDFSFALSEDETFGYFSSNRKGSDRIFHFDLFTPIRFEHTLKGLVTDMADKPLPGSTVTVTDKEGNEIISVITDESGNYSVKIPERYKEITINGKKKNYLPATTKVTIPENVETMTANIKLDQDPCNFLDESPIFSVHFDFDATSTHETMDLDKLSHCMRVNPKVKMSLEGHTDSKGSKRYNYKLGNGRVGFVKGYLLEKGVPEEQIKGKSYGEDKLIEKEDPKEKQYRVKYRKNRRVELKLVRE